MNKPKWFVREIEKVVYCLDYLDLRDVEKANLLKYLDSLNKEVVK